jgi:hypothetical protein
MSDWEPYEGSARQRRTRRRTRIVAIVILLALVIPLLLGTVGAVAR